MNKAATLNRETFTTSRLMDFFSIKELTAQIGHDQDEWPLVAIKELVDNAIDACEENDIAPIIHVTVDDSGISVKDNGPGIPEKTIDGVLNYSVRVSSREAYVSPTRGAQGNALKTLVAMPFVLDGSEGTVEVGACGVRHRIVCRVDMIKQQPEIQHHKEHGLVKNGTFVKVHWPAQASLLQEARFQILQVLSQYAALNPHLTLSADVYGEKLHHVASSASWQKWKANEPTSAHWYSGEQLKKLISNYINLDEARGREPRTIREFVSEFRGLTSTGKQKKVLAAIGMSRQSLRALTSDGDFDDTLISRLLQAMQAHSTPVKPKTLGLIGKEHLEAYLRSLGGKTFKYKSVLDSTYDDIPYALEVAFAFTDNEQQGRLYVTGTNWSPGIHNMFRSSYTDGLLSDLMVGRSEPVIVVIHLATAKPNYTDRGKSAINLDYLVEERLRAAIKHVTSEWTTQRKAEERDYRQIMRRTEQMLKEKKPEKITIKQAAFEIMEEAYLKASNNGKLPALARQIMYAARKYILVKTGKGENEYDKLDSRYFTQDLLPEFIDLHTEKTKDWDVVYDARGNFFEPHTGARVPLGTIGVRGYLFHIEKKQAYQRDSFEAEHSETLFPTYGPVNRYSAVLFIEKEGFLPLFDTVQLGQRYDIAIMSTKGMSVIAARNLADRICGGYDIPLLILRDFDKAGFSIASTIQNNSRRFKFKNEVKVIDLGIRLEDVKKYNLEPEPVTYKSDPTENLRENGATDEEIEFLYRGRHGDTYYGERVELNAFMSNDFVEWIEDKLRTHGIKKVMPNSEGILEAAYRREYTRQWFNKKSVDIAEEANEKADEAVLPDDLTKILKDALEESPEISWDAALAELVEVDDEDND